jgi:hypothetical protein
MRLLLVRGSSTDRPAPDRVWSSSKAGTCSTSAPTAASVLRATPDCHDRINTGHRRLLERHRPTPSVRSGFVAERVRPDRRPTVPQLLKTRTAGPHCCIGQADQQSAGRMCGVPQLVRFDSERDARREFRNCEEAAASRSEKRLRAPALRLEAEAGSCAPSAPEDRLSNPPPAVPFQQSGEPRRDRPRRLVFVRLEAASGTLATARRALSRPGR